MEINKAIECERETSEKFKNQALDCCSKNLVWNGLAEYHKQIADWLEELKMMKEGKHE